MRFTRVVHEVHEVHEGGSQNSQPLTGKMSETSP